MNPRTPLQHNQGSIYIFLLFGLVALYACVLFLPEIFMSPIGNFLKVDEQPQKTDAIVVLLGGSGPERVIRANELLEMEAAPIIAFGSGYRNMDIYEQLPENFVWPNSSTSYKLALESLGVSEEKVQVIDTSSAYDTALELTSIGEFARQNGWKKIMLVSGVTHTKRASMIWKRINPDIYAITSSAWHPGFEKWWQHGQWRRSVGYEYGALIKEMWANIEAFLVNLTKKADI